MAMKQLNKILFNPDRVEEMREDCEKWERAVQRALRSDGDAGSRINVQETMERIRRVKQQLNEEVADGKLTDSEKDQLARRERELRAKITHGMLDEETMRKCPSDAPNRHLQWERANMPAIIEWKNIRQQLDPENNEAQNLEAFRPRGAQGYGYRADAAISGKMSMSDLPAENFQQALSSEPSHMEKRKKRILTIEQRAQIGKRLAEARAKKAQATA